MKVICAGYPKTGSKSCSTALRKLGYNVADILETIGSKNRYRNKIDSTLRLSETLVYDTKLKLI